MKYGELNLGQVEAIVNKLGGMEGVRRFLAGELVVKGVERQLKIWKTIKLGLHKSAEEYRKALTASKCNVGDYAGQIIDNISISQEEIEVDLVLVTSRELGFKENTRRDAIYNRAIGSGLLKCPGEVGPALREQYPDQPNGEVALIGMDPIADSDGNLNLFNVKRHDSELWLNSNWSNPDNVWNPDNQWVFRLPRNYLYLQVFIE